MASVTEMGQYPDDVRTSYGVDAAGKPVTIEQRTTTASYAVPVNNNNPNNFARLDPDALAITQPQTRIFLRPIAMPSCLGMAAFFGGTWVFSTFLCGWYQDNTQFLLFPFAFFFGGLAQFISGYYGFPARDNLATVFHVTWGSFYMAYGLLIMLYVLGYLGTNVIAAIPFAYTTNLGLATWLVVVAAITWTVCLASLGRDFLIFLITLFQAVGATIMFAGYYADKVTGAVKTGAYFMMVSSVLALLYVFVTLIADAALSNQDQALAAYNSNNANRGGDDRASGFRNRLTSWHGALPWQPTTQAIRIPLAEPGIKKGQ